MASPDDEDPPIAWGRLAVSAYGPVMLSSIGFGAATPLIALSALDLGASVEVSALVIGLTAIGQLCGDLPASWLATKLGERWAMCAACLWDAVFLFLAFQARELWLLGLAVFAFGLSGAVFGLARQSYLTEAIPFAYRARALSTLGGVFRVGQFLGPLAGAFVVAVANLSAAYGFAAVMSLAAAGATALLPELPSDRPSAAPRDPDAARLWHVLWEHRRVFATLGTGIMVISTTRSARQAILPLWCESIGLDASATSLVYAVSMAVDMSLFFLGGSIMDRFGRVWVAVPSLVVLGAGLIALAFTSDVPAVVAVAVLLGLGNGVGAGIVMTLGSDQSPEVGRAQFLSGWRLMGDGGHLVAPLAISGITALATLGAAAMAMGALAWTGCVWLGYWILHTPPRAAR
ncbi:MAG: MFS transporter [Propionibacteriaceae bacterium]|jgi:MFS family permease|nr:MFS transporter [Propionibacteriaceae bacterium]